MRGKRWIIFNICKYIYRASIPKIEIYSHAIGAPDVYIAYILKTKYTASKNGCAPQHLQSSAPRLRKMKYSASKNEWISPTSIYILIAHRLMKNRNTARVKRARSRNICVSRAPQIRKSKYMASKAIWTFNICIRSARRFRKNQNIRPVS